MDTDEVSASSDMQKSLTSSAKPDEVKEHEKKDEIGLSFKDLKTAKSADFKVSIYYLTLTLLQICLS